VISCLVVGFVSIIVFFFYENYSNAPNKVLPVELFSKIRGFDLYCLCLFCSGFLVYSINSYWPIISQNVYARPGNYTDIGILGVFQGTGVMSGNFILIFIMKPLGHLKYQLMAALGWQAIWISVLALITPTSKGMAETFVCLGGIGVSWSIGVALVSISLSIGHEHIGVATGAANAMRLTGATVGLAAYSAILSSKIGPELAASVIPAAISAGLPPSSGSAVLAASQVFSATAYNNVPGITPAIIDAANLAKKWAYINVYNYLWFTGMAMGLFGMVCAFLARDMSSRMSNKVDVDLDKVKSKKKYRDTEIAEK